MEDDKVVQFVPGLKPHRVSYDDEVSPEQIAAVNKLVAPEFADGNWVDTSPCEYVAPTDDCA